MKKHIILIIIFTLALFLGACSDNGSGNGNDGGKGLVVGENAFEVGVYVKNVSSESVNLKVDPSIADVNGVSEDEKWSEIGPNGNYGTIALVAGDKKGNNAELDGSFTIYANDTNGPSIVTDLSGKFVIEELTSYGSSYFFFYKDGGFQQTTKDEF